MRRGRELGEEVSAALADVQARQQSLARGSVLPRASSPLASAHAASSHPPPVSKDKIQRVAPFQWLQRRVARRSDRKESAALEDVGSLELVPSASLATARMLIGDFITLPARREFAFIHPITNAQVDAAQEQNVYVADIPFICIVLLPKETATVKPVATREVKDKKAAPSQLAAVKKVATIEVKEEQQRLRPETAFPQQQQPQQEQQQRPQTVETGVQRVNRRVVTADTTAVSSPVGEVSGVKRERDVVRSRREQQPTLLSVNERKQTSDESKAENEPLHTPAKLPVTKNVTADGSHVSDNKRANSASLPIGPSIKPSQTKLTEQDTTEKQKVSVPQRRRTSLRVPIVDSDVVIREPKYVEEKPPASADTKTVQVTQEVVLKVIETAQFSPNDQEKVYDDGSSHAVRDAAVTMESIPEVPTASEKSIHQRPGHLRRSRRFRGLAVATLAEKSWGIEEPEQQEVASDEEVEEFIQSILEIFRTGLVGVVVRKLDAALLYYGVDYLTLELHGVLLALDTELGTRCNHVRGGVDGLLKQYLLKIFPVDEENMLDPEALQLFEFALNLFVEMRGWQSYTKLRASCFEEKHPLQLIPASDSRRLAMLRLSDRDHQLLTLASSDNTSFENWLADGMEITYVLLFGFLLSRRNSGPKSLAKLDALHLRQDRIQAAIQNLTSFSFDVWKRLEFRTTDIEDTSMVKRLKELIKTFLRDSKLYSGDLAGSVFFPALVSYLKRKSEQLGQSLSGIIQSAAGARGPLQTTVLEYLRLLRQSLEQPDSHTQNSSTYMQSMGLKILDVDKINASRSNNGLGRIYVNGKESILTHHQCKLMTRERNLQLKARWDQPELTKGETSRYCFLGAKEIALEYVFVRTKLPLTSVGGDMCWEDREVIARKEVQQAFALLCGDSPTVPLNVAIGVGVNIIHAELLPHFSSVLSLGTILREYSGVTAVSFGYCLEPVGQIARVVFRVHTNWSEGKHGNLSGVVGCWGLLDAIKSVNQFLDSAQEEEAIAFCEAEGLRFLNSCLQERGHQWLTLTYGKQFFDYINGTDEATTAGLREDLLHAMKQTIAIIPRVSQSITKTNIHIIVHLINIFPDASNVRDEAINVLMTICSNNDQRPTRLPSEYVALPMTKSQKQFVTQTGLEILVNVITKLQGIPAYKESVETMIISLLTAHEISATKAGYLVHWREWLEFFVENRAWTRFPAGPNISVFLLRQIDTLFFSSASFSDPEMEACPCGCDGHFVGIVDACIGVMKVFVGLMLTEVGVPWAQEEMHGPRDCVLFLLWSAQLSHWAPTMAELQQLLLCSLCEFLERMTSSHQYLRILSELTSPLLDLLHQQNCVSLRTGVLRVLSLAFRLAVDKKVWTISMETFLDAFYKILESFCDDPAISNMNTIMISVLFNLENHRQGVIFPNILLDLHQEHVNFVGGCGQLSPVARSRTKSLLQTLVSFCSLTWNSVLQPVCQIPALISLGWMLTCLEVADDLAQLDVDEVLLTLMENESVIVSILAARVCVIFFFQWILSRHRNSIDEYKLKRFCNLLATVIASGSRLILSPKRSSNSENSEEIQLAANTPDTFLIFLRYKALNSEKQNRTQQNELYQGDALMEEKSPAEIVWEANEWNDANRATAEKLATHLKLLVVFSSMTRNVILIGNSDEIREIILLLVRFVRERMHSSSYQTTLYLLSLRNIVWATRLNIAKWGITELIESSFLRKLLVLAKDKLYQDVASGILWGLADAYEKTNIFLLSFEVDDALVTGSYFTKKIGFAVMVDNLPSKLAAGLPIENDSGVLASMITNPTSSSFFVANYGYSFVLKLIESSLRLIRGESMVSNDKMPAELAAGEPFGTKLFYSYPIKDPRERELFQLCRAAVTVLEALQRINSEAVLDELARTKATVLPLLDYPNKQVARHAVLCCCIHLQAHPTKCGKLLEDDVQDKVIAFFFDDEYPPIQIAAFSCMKLVFADQKNIGALQLKLFPVRGRIVSCLRSSDFEVKRKAILFLVEAVFRVKDQTFLDGLAEAFAATDNNGLLMDLFDSISKEVACNQSAGSVLQLLVRLILKLNLVAHTGGDQLVHVICHTLKTHSNDTFLRPMLFNFLHQILTQENRAEYLERKGRLDVLTDLLSHHLTLNELRNVANMLLSVASKHDGVRQYLSGFESRCIPKIVGVLNGFSEHVQSNDPKSSKQRPGYPRKDSGSEESVSGSQLQTVLDEGTSKYLLKVTTAKAVYISHFTEDIYERFLQLLLLLITGPEFSLDERYGCLCESSGCINCDPCDIIAKARCGHYILRLSAAHRVLCPTYNLELLLSTRGDPAYNIFHLTIKVLEALAANYQCRAQMLRRSAKLDWMWLPPLVSNAMLAGTQLCNGEQDKVRDLTCLEMSTADTIQLLGHLSASKEVAQRLTTEKPLISVLFSSITPTSDFFASSLEIRRASAFTLARLAEYPLIVRAPFLQGKMALLSHSGECDTVVQANKLILARNRTLLTPGLQGRSVDEGTLSSLAHLLLSKEDNSIEVGVLAADVLAGLVFFRINESDRKRTRSMLWRYTHAMSPAKATKDFNHPSSKRLTTYLHNWIKPMLQKLRQSCFGTFDEDSAQMLRDELAYTCKLLEEPSVGQLLRVLVSLHLPTADNFQEVTSSSNSSYDNLDVDLDVIRIYKRERQRHLRPRSLQYVSKAPDRATRESNDNSFRGSAHLWLFLRKLWEQANNELKQNSEQGQSILSDVVDIVAARLPDIFVSWKNGSAARHSSVAFDRRKCFLDFVMAVGKLKPRVLSAIDVKSIVDAVIRNGPNAALTMGREYLLLTEVCKHIPTNLDLMLKHFHLDCENNHDRDSIPSDTFRLFWNPVQLKLQPVTFTLSLKIKTTILDPSAEADLATIFGVDLLRLLSSHIPVATQWYAQCHGDTQLLDMMLLASKVSALQMQHFLARSFLSNLLWLSNQLLQVDQTKYHRIFASDPRYLRCIVDLIYAPAREVQTSAIKLLQNLAQQPRVFGMLSRLDNLVNPISISSTSVVSYVGEMLTMHKLTPPLSQDCMVLLAHISFVPFFTDLSTSELVKLSLGFRPCTQPAPNCWMILMNDYRFSSIPEWMVARNNTTIGSFPSAMKRIQKRFESSLGAHTDKTYVSMHLIDKETYMNHTSSVTRRRIAMRLDNLLQAHINDSKLYRGSVRARNGLVMRLGRLLVEDRAEIIRRVAYTKRVSERGLFEQMRTRQMSDLLLLLQEAPLFEGIQRDLLANLAFHLGNPVEFVINETATIENLPLLLLHDEDVEFEMHLPGGQEVLRGFVSRGGLLGFPSWMNVASPPNGSSVTVVGKCGLLGTVVSLEALESELPKSAFNTVNDRLRRAYEVGDHQKISYLMGQDMSRSPKVGKRHLQSSASSLIAQLITADVFVESLLNDTWAIGVIVDVGLAALTADVVLDALNVIAAITATEAYTKRFCVKLITAWSDGKAKEPTTSLLRPVVVFVNRFKLRLWQNHTQILEKIFLIQSNFASYLPAFWTHLEEIWTPEYLRICLALLRSDQNQTPEVVGCHLSSAIHHRMDYLLQCGHNLDLNLAVAHVLVRTTTCSENVIGILQLFDVLSSDESLCEPVWDRVINSSDAIDGVMKLVASAVNDCFDLHNTSALEVYCKFLYGICTTGINVQLELTFRYTIQNRFGILSSFLQRLHELPEGHTMYAVLRCIGGICIDVPSNCSLSTTRTLRSDDKDDMHFMDFVFKALKDLEDNLKNDIVVEASVVEAIFSCVDAITSVGNQNECFEPKRLVTIGLRVVQILTSPPQTLHDETVIALLSVVKLLFRAATCADGDFMKMFDEERVSAIVAGYESVSEYYSNANDDIQLLRLLERYAAVLDALLSSSNFRDVLWAACFNGVGSSISFVARLCEWMIFNPCKSPAISALNPNRASKRDRLVAVANKMQTVTWSMTIKLSEHACIGEILSLQPKFSEVIGHIFSALDKEIRDVDLERATQWMKFMCFMSEQWDERTSVLLWHSDRQHLSAINSFLANVHVPTLLKACDTIQAHRGFFVCYAIRFLWLLVKLEIDAEKKLNAACILDNKWSLLVPLATDILKSQKVARRTKCNALGLLAELVFGGMELISCTKELKDLVHAALAVCNESSLSRGTMQLLAPSITDGFLSSKKWSSTGEDSAGEYVLKFALTQQCQRFVLSLYGTPEIRAAIFNSDFFHPLMCRTLFHDAVIVLNVIVENELWVRAQIDALQLLSETLLGTSKNTEDQVATVLLSALRSYRQVARREQFLKHCTNLLSGPWKPEFQCAIVESMTAYVSQNISASYEVAALREQSQGDLMEILLTSIVPEDISNDPESPHFSVLCLRLFNSIIEFSYINAKYATRPEFWERFRKLRLAASAQNKLMSCDLPQTLYFIFRLTGNSECGIDCYIIEEIWELTSTVLLHPLITSHIETVKYILEIVLCFVTIREELYTMIAREWDKRGKRVVLRLVSLVKDEFTSNEGVSKEIEKPIAKLSTEVLTQLSFSDMLSKYMSNDSDIVTALLSNIEYPWSKWQTKLLQILVTRESADQIESHLSEQLMNQISGILTLDRDHRINLLAILPYLIQVFDVLATESDEGGLTEILHCIVNEMNSTSDPTKANEYHLLVATKALASILEVCHVRDIPSETLLSLHEKLHRQVVYTLPIFRVSNSDELQVSEIGQPQELVAILSKQPSAHELWTLSNLTKLSPYVEDDLSLVEQHGMQYFSWWIISSICRDGDVRSEDYIILLSSLVLNFLLSSQHTTLFNSVAAFRPYWRVLTRMFVGEGVHFNVSKLMLQLIRGPTYLEFRCFVSDTFKLDLIEVLWWEISTIDYEIKAENDELRELWYSILNELCYNRDNALAIMEKTFLEDFIGLEYHPSDDDMMQSIRTTKLICLIATVFRVTNFSDQIQFFRKDPPKMEVLAELCVGTISTIIDMSEAKWKATEILYSLTVHEQTLTTVWKVFGLSPDRLHAVSELLLQCEDNIADLILVLTFLLRVCEADKSITILIQTRNASDCWPMVDVLVEVFQQCIGDTIRPSTLPNSNLRPIVLTTNSPADFLPYHLPTELHTKATVLTLQLVHRCVTDNEFAQSLETEFDLLRSLLSCLATSSWSIASTAAVVLSTLLRRRPDAYDTEDYTAGVTRYMCDQGAFRHLEFFSAFGTQDMIDVSPPTLFPSWFVLLVRWLHFYSVNLTLLSDFQNVERFTCTEEDEVESLSEATESALHEIHEKLVASVLDLLLYIVSNFHSVIYTNDNGEAEEIEHSLFLQSLLALCQRRSRRTSGLAWNCDDDACIVSSSLIRSRALKLVQSLCSLDLPHTSSVEVFTHPQQMQIVMMIVERSTSDIEQSAAAQLMEALALRDTVKIMLIRNTLLLFRLGAWLEIESLRLLAAAIIQRLATPSSNGTRPTNRVVFSFAPSVQQQLAQFLFVGVQQNKIRSDLSKKNSLLLQGIRRIHVEVILGDNSKRSPRSASTTDEHSVQLKFEIVGQNGVILRAFEYRVTLLNGVGSSHHQFLIEPTANSIRCTMLTYSTGENLDPTETKFELSRGFTSSVHRSNSIALRISEQSLPIHNTMPAKGILPRLLIQADNSLSGELFEALLGIVAEFCKDFDIFCDPVVDLPSQILIILATSVEFSSEGKMDVACLESLTAWLSNNPTVSTFKSSIPPVLRLIQGLRQLSCVGKFLETSQHAIALNNFAPNAVKFGFLEKLVELIGSVESRDLTANALNTLFIENSDLLLYLCAQFNPDQSSEATFLSLVAITIRENAVHCQTFLSSIGDTLLRSVFDVGIQKCAGCSERQQGSLLYYASLVTMRLARCPIARHNLTKRTHGVELFSRVSFELFARHSWIEGFPTEIAENLILSCGFLCDGLLKFVAVDADTREEEHYAAFTTSKVPEDALTVVETLMVFLGRTNSDACGTIEGEISYDSYDRLAATILESLVEKLPSRTAFEKQLLQLLEARWFKVDSTFTKLFQEHCLAGIRKCIGLTRYDFHSELNALRLTYYSTIRAGVRTGIIPAQCSGVFQRFDQEHLLPTQSSQWHLNQIGGNEQLHRRQSYLWQSDFHLNTSSSKHLLAEDARVDLELRDLILFSNEHAELLSVLTLNRKKAMTTAIRVASQNAQVLMAFHAMTSIALDFYVDTATILQNQKRASKRCSLVSENLAIRQRRISAITNLGDAAQTNFFEWLVLLEQLAGLLCSGLHELDAAYYVEIAHEFRSLILDLPMFLRKMERMGTHSRQQALMLFLDNLHRLLKRATNRNELRVVAANGSGIVDQTKSIRQRLRNLDVHISTSLGVLLDSEEGMKKISRMLISMQYMWRCIVGPTSLERSMSSSRESISLLKKVKEKIARFLQVLRHPAAALKGCHMNSQAHEFDGPSRLQSTQPVTDSLSADRSSQRTSNNDRVGDAGRKSNVLRSSFPFISLELLLDHFGWESIAAKRIKQLLQSSEKKDAVLGVLKSAFGIGEEDVERMSVIELAERFHELETTRKISDVIDQFRQLTLEDELPFSDLPFVVHDKVEMSLWRLMVRPVQRLRLFHLYYQTQRFVLSDPTKRRVMLEGYGQALPQRLITANRSRDELSSESESSTKLVPKSQGVSICTRLFNALKNDQRIGSDQTVQDAYPPPPSATPTGPWTASKVAISQSTLRVCDGIFNPDPFSDDAAMILLRRKLDAQMKRRHSTNIARFRGLQTESSRSARYRYDQQDGVVGRIRHWVISLGAQTILLIAFWRQEELHTDLNDPVMARAFENPHLRDEYYRLYHAKKGLGELVRVWMPTSGRLGLLLWQEKYYAFGGTLLSIAIALWLPTLVFPDTKDLTVATASKRNTFMTRIVCTYGIGIFLLSVISIALIARNRFVLLEQTRLRLRPVSRYYQNVLAVIAIGVELVQLNSLAFDSAVEWDTTDQVPEFVQWLGNQGITQFGISSLSGLEALGILLLMVLWFLLLKCANKFRETSALLHRVLTKDLPGLVHGFLYMSTISVFFSFLACIDCTSKHSSSYHKCTLTPESPPFLIAHQNIICWTTAHQWYALLGLWGVTFFLPIGLLAHGMSQVLFQRETLDIKYAPVLILVVQLVKAAAATAKAFFPHDPIVLASLGVVGNTVLLVLTLVMHSCSLWYIKYIKCSIYAASCWASLGAIHRRQYLDQSSTRSLNMIYFGWLSIGLVLAMAILLRVWHRARQKQRDDERHFAAQQRLLNAGRSNCELGVVEQKFVKAARKHSKDALIRAAFISNAKKLNSSAPPPALSEFMARATEPPANLNEAARKVLFMQSARVMAKKLSEHEELRRRR